MSLPTQAIVNADCINYMLHSPNADNRFSLLFADPPFNIDHPYKGFKDKNDPEKFKTWMRDWTLVAWKHMLKPDGIMALHGNDNLCEMYLEIARDRGWRRIAWVNWHYRFGQHNSNNWIDSRCHCLIYAKGDSWTWNGEDVLVKSDRMTTYDDPRIEDSEQKGMRVPLSIWGLPSDGPYWGRVQGNSKERHDTHPNQLPEVYLARLIKAYTNENEWVYDPFCGSGTTAVVCKALKRNCITTDVSGENVESARKRLQKGAIRSAYY